MKFWLISILLFGTLGSACSGSERAADRQATTDFPKCAESQLLGDTATSDVLTTLRHFELPTIDYPHGTRKETWGLTVSLRIDEHGTPVCYAFEDDFGRKVMVDDQREVFVARLKQWRYTPLERDGQPVPMIATEQVREQELPAIHVPLPEVPLSKTRIVLVRSGCYGTCPRYLVELKGDGSARYKGDGFVDVQGEHRYQVPVADIAALVESLRAKDIWSMRPSYRAGITDNPTYELMIDLDGEVRTIEDYVGEMVGMPVAISEFEDEVDRVARSSMWTTVTAEGVDQLEREGFRFNSQAGADLLARAVANDEAHDDAAMVRLMSLGAPIRGAKPEELGALGGNIPLIESALLHRRVSLIEPLIAAGALHTSGRPDQTKIEAAFRAAIRGGSLEAVKAIWENAGTRPHPSLHFTDEGEQDDGNRVTKRAPVTLLLSGRFQPKQEWHGQKITQWLVSLGCDIKAARVSGDTLLHIAAEANDASFVRYLLDQGLDASAPGEFGLPPLASVQEESVALMLLEAGTDLGMMDDEGQRFVDYAKSRHWGRVVAWLERRSSQN